MALYVGSVLVVWWFVGSRTIGLLFRSGAGLLRPLVWPLAPLRFHLGPHSTTPSVVSVTSSGTSARGFKLTTVEWMVKANLIGSIVLTILLWVIAYGVKS